MRLFNGKPKKALVSSAGQIDGKHDTSSTICHLEPPAAPFGGLLPLVSNSWIAYELSSQSPESWEDATRQAVERASRSLRNIRSVWVKEFEAAVDADKVTQFRVVLKISFQLKEG
jgi:flavin-binding protein dodecin